MPQLSLARRVAAGLLAATTLGVVAAAPAAATESRLPDHVTAFQRLGKRVQLGAAGQQPSVDLPVAGDWDGDGDTTAGFVRVDRHGRYVWHVTDAHGGGAQRTFVLGREYEADWPIVGDWNGDGIDTPGTVRFRRDGLLQWRLSNTLGGPVTTQFTMGRVAPSVCEFDEPVVGDWDGDGRDSAGVVRYDERTGRVTWRLRNRQTSGRAGVVFRYGGFDDFPVVGDWDGNGVDGPGLVRYDGGDRLQWRLRNRLSAGAPGTTFRFGSAWNALLPISGDWDGDRRTSAGTLELKPIRDDALGWEWRLRNALTGGRAEVVYRFGEVSGLSAR